MTSGTYVCNDVRDIWKTCIKFRTTVNDLLTSSSHFPATNLHFTAALNKEAAMSNTKITDRQRYWRDHVLEAPAYSGSIVEYAESNNLETEDIYQLKTALSKRGFLPIE